jgi:hypothetical protein
MDDVTLYRAIADGEFPAVRIRKRLIVPARVIEMLVEDVVATGACIDVADWTTTWREQWDAAGVRAASWPR